MMTFAYWSTSYLVSDASFHHSQEKTEGSSSYFWSKIYLVLRGGCNYNVSGWHCYPDASQSHGTDGRGQTKCS